MTKRGDWRQGEEYLDFLGDFWFAESYECHDSSLRMTGVIQLLLVCLLQDVVKDGG